MNPIRGRAKRMDIYEYGNDHASVVLIEMVGEHNLPGIEQEIMEIRRLTDMDFRFIAVKVNNWNQRGHFKEPDIRMARAFTWVMKNLTGK